MAHDSRRDALQAVLSGLQGVKSTRDGGYLSLCPAHPDTNPSLSIRRTDDRILLHCHAGCPVEAVVNKLGLSKADLFLAPPARKVLPLREVAAYDYTDVTGRLLYQVVRYEPKTFRQRQPNGNGGWTWSLKGVSPVLFRLPRVCETAARGGQVFIVEGERDALTLEAAGCTATCNSGGAGKWRSEDAAHLRGAHVVVLPDNDEPGQAHAHAVAASIAGTAASVKVVALPNLPLKGDVSDWFAAGHTTEELRSLVAQTPEWAPVTPSGRYPLTDLGNAERLVAAHGGHLRYNVTAGAWLHWTGALWQTDDTGEVHRLARQVVRRIHDDLPALADGEERQHLFKHIIRSESHPRLEAMLQLARYAHGVPVTAHDLDSDPWALNCLNGVVDLRTGLLADHHPAGLHSKLAPVAYHPAAPCPRWEQFLRELFPAQDELVAFVQRLCGYLLTGDTREQSVCFLVGKGANGKSVLLETLRSVFGDYARDTAFSTFLERRDTTTADLAALHGARLVTASEGDGAQAFNEPLLKRLTGGDPVTCRYLYRDFFTYTPTFKIVFATNEVPRIQSQTMAMRRRLKILPFRQTFYAREEGREPVRDEHLRDRLREEAAGILAWAVRGCLDWQAHGLQAPACVHEETAALFDSLDPLAEFLDEQCDLHPAQQVESSTIWHAYQAWCDGRECAPAFRAPHTFTRALAQRDGIESQRKHAGRFLRGISLKRDAS